MKRVNIKCAWAAVLGSFALWYFGAGRPLAFALEEKITLIYKGTVHGVAFLQPVTPVWIGAEVSSGDHFNQRGEVIICADSDHIIEATDAAGKIKVHEIILDCGNRKLTVKGIEFNAR